jgi:hypothetical protein
VDGCSGPDGVHVKLVLLLALLLLILYTGNKVETRKCSFVTEVKSTTETFGRTKQDDKLPVVKAEQS